jgi:hypothetical protein
MSTTIGQRTIKATILINDSFNALNLAIRQAYRFDDDSNVDAGTRFSQHGTISFELREFTDHYQSLLANKVSELNINRYKGTHLEPFLTLDNVQFETNEYPDVTNRAFHTSARILIDGVETNMAYMGNLVSYTSFYK